MAKTLVVVFLAAGFVTVAGRVSAESCIGPDGWVSPGELSKAHSPFGCADDGCGKCHNANGVGTSDTLCAAESCHGNVARQRLDGKAFHGAGDASWRTCTACHQDHQGASFAMVSAGPASPEVLEPVVVGIYGGLILVALFGLGFLAVNWMNDTADALDGFVIPEWKSELACGLGLQQTFEAGSELVLEIDGAVIEVHSANGKRFELSGLSTERDLRIHAGGSGDGSGWEALPSPARTLLEEFAREGGAVNAGRITMSATGIAGAIAAVRRVAEISRVIAGRPSHGVSAILRRVASADDPGRVSVVEVPEEAGHLSGPGVAGSLSSKSSLASITRVWAASGAGEDRVLAMRVEAKFVVLVADGAGGTGGGAAAAERVVSHVQSSAAALVSGASSPADLLSELDRLLAPTGGEAAAVVVVVSPTGLRGACVGDVEAVLLRAIDSVDLTTERRRKPLLGSGRAEPVAFATDGAGRLLVATDGLFGGYAPRDRLLAVLRAGPLDTLPDRLVELVRLPSGELQDDVGLVICDIATDEPS